MVNLNVQFFSIRSIRKKYKKKIEFNLWIYYDFGCDFIDKNEKIYIFEIIEKWYCMRKKLFIDN